MENGHTAPGAQSGGLTLETEQLILRALTPDQLEKWVSDLPALEKELDCSYRADPVTGFFRDILASQAQAAARDPERYVWHSFFWMIRKTDRLVVGSADFKAPPDENGATEIGYGLDKAFQGMGYMTETVRAMCAWALGDGGAAEIIAETVRDNLPSQRVLTRCGFQKYQEGSSFWWRLTR